MLPSVSRIWLFSMPSVPGWLCWSSRLWRVVHADPRRDLLVIVVVAERVPQAELAGRRQPYDREGLRIHLVVELRRAHAERAQVVGEHRHVLDLGMELAFEPDAGGVRPPEELVGNQAVVHAEPVRELTLGAPHGGQRRDAGTHAHEPVEGPGQVARAHDLRRIALRGVRRPDVEVVAHLRREEPPRERREELLQLDVLAPLNGLRVAEGVDVGRVQIPLVQIPRVAEEPEIDLALVAVEQQEADVRNVREGLGLLRLRCHGGAGAELGAAAVRHPDAGLVVAPGPSEQTRRVAHRSQQHDALRRVGLALRTLTWLRCARQGRLLAAARRFGPPWSARRHSAVAMHPAWTLSEREGERARCRPQPQPAAHRNLALWNSSRQIEYVECRSARRMPHSVKAIQLTSSC